MTKTIWGTLALSRPIYVPMGRLEDLRKAIGDMADRCIVYRGRSWDSDHKVVLFASAEAYKTALKMGGGYELNPRRECSICRSVHGREIIHACE